MKTKAAEILFETRAAGLKAEAEAKLLDRQIELERLRQPSDTALLQQALDALESFLRCPSIGSNGPCSSTIVIQDFNRRKAASAIIALKERLNE